MGQKVRPIGFRVGIREPWRSRWYADRKSFAVYLLEDHRIREYVKGIYRYAGISRIEIERNAGEIRILLHTARPGIIIGRKGETIEKIRLELEDMTGRKVAPIQIKEVNRPELDGQLMAEDVAAQLTKRSSYRRTVKKAVETAMQAGAEGIKVQISGRLGGHEIARSEKEIRGRIPLQTLDAQIDYGFAEAATSYGNIGVKVWIYKGEYRLEKEGRDAGAEKS